MMPLGRLVLISGFQVTLFLDPVVTSVFAEPSLIPPSSVCTGRLAFLLRAFRGSEALLFLLLPLRLEEPRDSLDADPLEWTLGASIMASKISAGGSVFLSGSLFGRVTGGSIS